MKAYFLKIACLLLVLLIGAWWLSFGKQEDCTPDCTGHEFLIIQPGTFQMGSPESEAGRLFSEVQHTVTLTRGFRMLSTEVTQGQFESLMGYNPSRFRDCGSDCPVENVNWYEAAAYCNALSAAEGLASCYTCTGTGVVVSCEPAACATPYDCSGYRLPTEAEWEYAARAGTATATYNGDLDAEHLNFEQPNDALDPIAWFYGNSGDVTHAMGTRIPNSWGLYDMSGNVFEWCHDWYGIYPAESTDPRGVTTGVNRVLRGGSWERSARSARAAFRESNYPVHRSSSIGFRPVRSIEP